MKADRISLSTAFNLNVSGELLAFVGGGGKSSLMFALARELSTRVITTTTTRIFAAQMRLAPTFCTYTPDHGSQIDAGATGDLAELGPSLEQYGSCLVVGSIVGDKALGVPPDLPERLLARDDVDYVLVEADGSRMRPLKAPAAHEPVIPLGATLVVPVVGIDAVGGVLERVAHRPELASRITGLQKEDMVTVEAVSRLITDSQGGLKGVPERARVIAFINKVEDNRQLQAARQIARLVLHQPRVEQVAIGAARETLPDGSELVKEIHQRVTAVVLAAGQSQRMGRPKLLLPWGDTTVLGQTLRNLKQTGIHDMVVVSGHEAERVEAIAAEFGVPTVRNDEFARGEMLSSLQLALKNLPGNRAAVLVMLADQPMIEPRTVDQLLVSFWQHRGELIAPVYRGRRGNPVLIGRVHFPELLALPQGAAPRDLLKRHISTLCLVEVDSISVLRDLDQPDEYERYRPAS